MYSAVGLMRWVTFACALPVCSPLDTSTVSPSEMPHSAALSALSHTRSRPYFFVISMRDSMLAVWVCEWMACLPPMRRSSLPIGMVWGSTHTGVRESPAFSQASLANWIFSVGVFHFGTPP